MQEFQFIISVTSAVVGTIVCAIMVLTIFFKIVSRFSHDKTSLKTITIENLLDETTQVVVRLKDGTQFENIRIIGHSNSAAADNLLPYELQNLVILEQLDGTRLMIPAKLIHGIVVPPFMK